MVSKMVLAVGALVVLVIAYAAFNYATAKPVYHDDSSPVMYFYSAQCSHCRAMTPILNELAAKGYRVKLMDVLKNPNYWKDYSIEGTPTWIAANGERISGEQGSGALEAWLAAHGAKIK